MSQYKNGLFYNNSIENKFPRIMPLRIVILVVVLSILTVYNSHKIDFDKEIEFKGMTFVGDKYCPEVSYEDPLSNVSLDKLKETGANWVAIVVTEYQDYVDSTEIYPLYGDKIIKNEYYTYKTESIQGLTKVINYANSIDLKVMLKPHIDISKEPKYNQVWRGNIGEKFTSPGQWEKWFGSYNKFITKYAQLAEILHVEMFSLSCELIATSHEEANWRKVIRNVKQVYSGLLTDSANHDGEEYEKKWWDEVDYIGVDAYYLPIQSVSLHSIEKQMENQLQDTLLKLRTLSRKFNKNVIITEIGFCSGNCLIGKRDEPPMLTDHYIQAYFYETFIKIFSKETFIKGFFWWAWNSDPYYGGDSDNCISPQHKIAEYVLRNYYGGDMHTLNYHPEERPKCLCTI